jgi:uncharacterized phage protein (TIGR02218 family)
MSPFQTEDASVESGRPLELYKITLGSEVFRITSAAEVVNADGQTWLPHPGIERDNITLGSEERGQQKSFTLYGNHPFVQRFTTGAPSLMPTIEVFQVHAGDLTDVQRIWEGEITEIAWRDNAAIAVISARSYAAALDSRTPRRDAGALCPYMLYDSQCGLAEASFKYSNTAGGVSGNTMTVSGLDASKGVGWATAGKIVAGNEVRVILAHTATDTIELGHAFQNDPTGLTVDVFAGCDHTLATCASAKFGDNSINFGGNPYVPTKDIQRHGIM